MGLPHAQQTHSPESARSLTFAKLLEKIQASPRQRSLLPGAGAASAASSPCSDDAKLQRGRDEQL